MSTPHRTSPPVALVPQLEDELLAAARHSRPPQTKGTRVARGMTRSWWRSPIIAVPLTILAFAAAALAAQNLLANGKPVTLPAGYRLAPRTGLGIPRPGIAPGALVESGDPAGGPAWGARFITTTRGYGCLQIGRVLHGQLGVIGQDNAFGNDMRFHALPTDYLEGPFPCAPLDADGHAYAGVYIDGAPASAQLVEQACTARGGLTHTSQPQCPARDERLVMAGMAGPLARTITYTDPAGQPHTITPSGPQGIYLIVLQAPSRLGLEGGEYEPGRPGAGLIRRITYANGQVCNTPQELGRTSNGCPNVGEQPVRQHGVSAGSVRSPLTVILKDERVRMRYSTQTLPMFAISFRARVPVTSGASEYVVSVQCRNLETSGPVSKDIRRGQTVTENIAQNGCRGTAHIRVAYVAAGGADGLPFALGRPGYTVGTRTINIR